MAITAGVLFLAAMFISPIAGIVPAAATAPALVIVGFLMMATLTKGEAEAEHDKTEPKAAIDFSNLAFGIPAVLIMTIMPLTYSITNGIGFGFIAYTLIRDRAGQGARHQLDAVDRDRRLPHLLPRAAVPGQGLGLTPLSRSATRASS